jgi:hypothetical protein
MNLNKSILKNDKKKSQPALIFEISDLGHEPETNLVEGKL